MLEGAARARRVSLSQLADRPGPRGAAHQCFPSYIRLIDRAAERPHGGLKGSAWLVLPVKQKLSVISRPQTPSDVRVFY